MTTPATERTTTAMRHTWIAIQPADANADQSGMQQMLSFADPADLERQVTALLGAWDMEPVTPLAWGACFNQDAPLSNPEAGEGEESGLLVALVPCHASGHNVDVDPCEPRGE